MNENGQDDARSPSGVPLGGLGTGCIEFGADARFRNLTINNNRTSLSRIPIAPNAFLAVRASHGAKTYARILQPETSIPFAEGGAEVTYTPAEETVWTGLYPVSTYQLQSDEFPLSVEWTALAPIIPYDMEASSLPTILFDVAIHNPTEQPYLISAMFNWENLRGCTQTYQPEKRGVIRPIGLIGDHEFAYEVEGFGLARKVRSPIGLSFGYGQECRTNAEGDYCLIATGDADPMVSYLVWDGTNPDDARTMWTAFADRGQLPSSTSQNEQAYCGSVCTSSNVAPGETRHFVFCFSWYCPLYEVAGTDQGNGYANTYTDSIHIGLYTLKDQRYFAKAIPDWQQRFLASSLPDWYSRMLINSCHVFSTNTLISRDGSFGMFESPEDPVVGALDRSFYSSIGTLLFFPNLVERELEMFSKTDREPEPGRIYRDLGVECFHQPGYAGSNRGCSPETASDEKADINAKFVLMAYRNYHMTGRLPALRNIFPRLKQAMEYGLYTDSDRDGIPDAHGNATTFDGWAIYGLNSYAAGLWIAATVAYIRIARDLKYTEEAAYYEKVLKTSIQHFERRLWNAEAGYYRLYHDPTRDIGSRDAFNDACHAAQTVGAWISRFLNLRIGTSPSDSRSLFSQTRIRESLRSIDRLCATPNGVAVGRNIDGTACVNPSEFPDEAGVERGQPGLSAAYFASPLIYFGSAERGVSMLNLFNQSVVVQRQRTFDQPLWWDLAQNDGCGWGNERHMSCLSVWYTLFAIQGFFLDVPEKTVYVAPNLPKGIKTLNTPIFTPLCLGRLKYEERKTGAYRQMVKLSFDSPVHVREIQLRTPKQIPNAVSQILVDGEVCERTQENILDEDSYIVHITLTQELRVQQSLSIRLREPSDSTEEEHG